MDKKHWENLLYADNSAAFLYNLNESRKFKKLIKEHESLRIFIKRNRRLENITSRMAYEITFEVDNEIMNDLRIASGGTPQPLDKINWDNYKPPRVSKKKVLRKLNDKAMELLKDPSYDLKVEDE